MDSTLLQLFSAAEILNRLGEKQSTGALHVFTAKESANIFFREGLLVGALKGLVEGEDVVKQVLEWSEPRFMWQSDVPPAAPLAKPMEIAFPDLLMKLKAAPKLEMIGGRPLSGSIPRVTGTEAPAAFKSAPVPPPAPEASAFKSARLPQVGKAEAPPAFKSSKLPVTGKMGPPPAFKSAKLPTVAKVESASLPRNRRTELVQTRPPSFAGAATTGPVDIGTTDLTPAPPALTATKSLKADPRAAHEEALLEKYKLMLVATGDQPARQMRLVRISSLVGRNPACDFTIDHPSISRQHCLLQITDRGLHVKDLGTTNGTKVNGIVLTEGYINVDDKLTMGHLSFFLEKDETVY